jgi:hypothetical protein
LMAFVQWVFMGYDKKVVGVFVRFRATSPRVNDN